MLSWITRLMPSSAGILIPQKLQVGTGWVKEAGHTSSSTADSETWSLVGANDSGLKRKVIPVLAQVEVTLQRPVKLVCKENNTACIAAIKRGYSIALRH